MSMADHDRWLCDLTARLVATYRLPSSLVAAAAGLEQDVADHLLELGCDLATDVRERLGLFVNIVVRAEVRCGCDVAGVRAMLMRPVGELQDRAPAEVLGVGVTALRQVREVIAILPLPKVRMWRAADSYG